LRFTQSRRHSLVLSPALYFVSGVLQRQEPIHAQAFVPEAAVERLELRIIRRRAGPGIVQLDLVEVRLGVQRPREERRPVVDFDPLWQIAGCLDFPQYIADLFALDRLIHIDGQAFPAERVQYRQRPEPLSPKLF